MLSLRPCSSQSASRNFSIAWCKSNSPQNPAAQNSVLKAKKKQTFRFAFLKDAERLVQLLFDTCCLTAQLTQVVQLSLANITTTLNSNAIYQLAVSLEGTLDTDTV